jgi:hypothetical protein
MDKTRCLVRVGEVRAEYWPVAVLVLSTPFSSLTRRSKLRKIDRVAGRFDDAAFVVTPKGQGVG